ncbi:MAG: DEAD/DEAH box helicase family protein, partial [Candidatus Methylomirabilis sp.]|nr:DEAD/DEAH box helicase family protein [Deltaproteobacteria bacterium]
MPEPMNIDARIAPACQDEMREAIREAGGREVFFLGVVDDRGRLQAAEVLARGPEDAVPVVPRGAEPGAVMIHNHPGDGPLAPSQADLAIASTYASAGVGHYLVDNAVSAIYVIVEPAPPKKRVPVDLQEVSEILGAGGALARVLPGYELREGQLEMAESVARALSDGGIAVVEAGTGIGKSMAYLVPALLWARANGERVVVATHTINLQEQLYGKDLPLLARALSFEVKAALVKGRTNYVCLRKLHALAEENRVLPGVEDALAREVADLVKWSETSEEGSRSDLAAPPSEEVWERVQSESDTCLRLACPYFQKCFFYKSRRRAAAAEIVVANHALLFSDLSVRREMGSYKAPGVLPPFGAVLLDEAHHLEEVATRHFGKRVTRRGMLRLLGRLHRAPGKGDKGARGVFPLLREKLLIAARREGVDAEEIGALEAAMEEALLPMRDALGERIEGLSTALVELLAHVKASREGEDARPDRQLRLASWVREAAFFREHVLGLAGE